MLEDELATYHLKKSELQEQHPSGGFVVIKDEEILGVRHDRQDAIGEGYKKYGDTSFLVKNIGESITEINFSRNYQFA